MRKTNIVGKTVFSYQLKERTYHHIFRQCQTVLKILYQERTAHGLSRDGFIPETCLVRKDNAGFWLRRYHNRAYTLRWQGACSRGKRQTVHQVKKELNELASSLVSPDVRAGMAMVIAAMVAHGESRISNVYQIERGYEKLVERLKSLGAHIKKVDIDE